MSSCPLHFVALTSWLNDYNNWKMLNIDIVIGELQTPIGEF